MSAAVQLVGLDFGTTTSSAVIASAKLTRNAVTGRTELRQLREGFRSELVFTPLHDERLDEAALERLLDDWLAAGNVRPEEVFGGGALLTGLTAQKDNAATLVRLVRRRLGDALVATADDPCLESWLAFMGSCAALSRSQPHLPVLNLDIGGGTTNLALGRAGEVLRTGCLFVGARHVQVEPGGYRIVKLSRFAQALFAHLGIVKGPGEKLTEAETQAVLDWYMRLLEAAATGAREPFQEPVAGLHEQVALHLPPGMTVLAVTFSGGVGELIYAHLQRKLWPPTTQFGDLGIDLARRLAASPVWADSLRTYRPASAGRATVYGLLRHTTEISGSTLFLTHPNALPLADVPILGTLGPDTSDADFGSALDLVRRSARGGCLRVALPRADAAGVRALGQRLARILRESAFPAAHPLVLLMRVNFGKILGHYVTDWGRLPLDLLVIDEVADRSAQYLHVGRLRDQVLPVSFRGLNEPGETPCVS
jgi:ethanolamine utilization protein EutA